MKKKNQSFNPKKETQEYTCVECGHNCTNNGEIVEIESTFICCNCWNIQNQHDPESQIELCSLCNEVESDFENEQDYTEGK